MTCVKEVKHKKIKVGENGRSAIFGNPEGNKAYVGQIDDCIVKNGARCDCFVSSLEIIWLVEFKGCNIDHACEQLLSTLKCEEMDPYFKGKSKALLIVCSRFPRNNTSVQRTQAKARREFSATLKVACNKVEIPL